MIGDKVLMCSDVYCISYHRLQFQYRDQESFFQLNLWLYGFMLKLVPCLVLTVFTASLIRAMTQVFTRKPINLSIQ